MYEFKCVDLLTIKSCTCIIIIEISVLLKVNSLCCVYILLISL